MGKFELKKADLLKQKIGDDDIELITKSAFNSFNENTLGLGDLSLESVPTNALAAIFDLSGFTNFCKQIDPHLVVPDFLNSFLRWIYGKIRIQSIIKEHTDGFEVWCNFPFYSKFLGDGLLFLWNTKEMTATEIGNIVVTLNEICDSYISEFYKDILEDYSAAPDKLRCGIARGIVYSVGDGNDFIGPCINAASRLQKIGSLSFCFSKRGLNYKKQMSEMWADSFITKRITIRGIGDDELVCISKKEFENLSVDDKKLFR